MRALIPLMLPVPLVLAAAVAAGAQGADSIPLPEHPRPDFQRAEWLNLNGRWRFAFDARDEGERAGWTRGDLPGSREILVPFSWGAPLSGVSDSADVAWYARSITVPESWRGCRVWIVFGASDWRTSVWLDGERLGDHQGGYTPFEFELTSRVRPGRPQRLVARVDDTDHPFKLEGKQGYGKARGMWQTVYMETRGTTPLASVHFTPKQDLSGVVAVARLHEPAPRDLELRLTFDNLAGTPTEVVRVPRGATVARVDRAIPDARRWSLDDPFLHEVTATLRPAGAESGDAGVPDVVRSYFGMRTISVVNLPGTTHRYVALNGRPVYLQLALDQAYHPQGYYTFPSDSALRHEIAVVKQIGLNGVREHIKIEAPRKLYWADRLGVLVMADVPNWWGPPDSAAFREHETALRGMIARDYNHPSVFSWVLFNETWGLTTRVGDRNRWLPETQRTVVSVYRLAKSVDSTRLVEDNSPCCGMGHTETDLNSWHEYLPGWEWSTRVARHADSTFPGSPWNFEEGFVQARQPMINSEFGNVWGYEGSTGDVDWSWDYRRAMDAFRRTPRLAGWLYTEHHDVINEWNGYWRYDRTWKETGFGDLVPGMTLNDLHAALYVAVGDSLSRAVRAGERVEVPLYASFLTDATLGDSLTLVAELRGWNALGDTLAVVTQARRVPYAPWLSRALEPLAVTMPGERAVAVLGVRLEDASGRVLHRNFTTFVVEGNVGVGDANAAARAARVRVSSVPAAAVSDARWSLKQWTVLDGLKVNGAGSGHFEYRIPWPAGVSVERVREAYFLVEASAKRLNGKDRDTTARQQGDYMRGGGFHDRSRNPNSYPMTSEEKFPSRVRVSVNGRPAGAFALADDPADSRGILSWHAQLRDRRLREAGSYGQLLRVRVPDAALREAARTGSLVVRLEVDDALAGGLAIYGARFGWYPVEPSVVMYLR